MNCAGGCGVRGRRMRIAPPGRRSWSASWSPRSTRLLRGCGGDDLIGRRCIAPRDGRRGVMDANEFIRNVGSHSPDEMVPFEEQYVAWSEDGKHVLAHAPTREDLYREIDAKGLTRYVV